MSKSNKEPDHVKEESNLLLDKMCQETTNFCHRRTFEENVKKINFTHKRKLILLTASFDDFILDEVESVVVNRSETN